MSKKQEPIQTEIVLPSDQTPQTRNDQPTQATSIEQQRAIAEVQGAIIVAQQCRRNTQHAITQMREACQQQGLADRAFFSFPRGGQTVAGASIHLARELARCWGNVQYGITELRRDDKHKVSEMMAWAWDVETNVRASSTFVVPHTRDTRTGPKDLTESRDIYENNANQGARRLREAIFSIIPTWFTEEAQQVCHATIANQGGDKPLAQRITDATELFSREGIDLPRLEAKLGRAKADWTVNDLAKLRVSYTSIQQGTVTKEQEFPDITEPTTLNDITGATK